MKPSLTRRKVLSKIITLSGVMVLAGTSSCAWTNRKDLAKKHTHYIDIKDFEYYPANIKVTIGDRIIWTNQDIAPHTVTAKDKSWDSKLIKQGDSWHLNIKDGIETSYYCLYHPNMKAKFSNV